MKTYKNLSFSQKIRWRIRGLWALLIAMLVYMVVVGELGWGDSRVVTRFADTAGSIMFFGGMIYVGVRIAKNKALLKDIELLKEQMQNEQDELNQYLHDKSGGIVWDIIFIALLFITMTTSLINMPAFYTSWTILMIAILAKVSAYLFYRGR